MEKLIKATGSISFLAFWFVLIPPAALLVIFLLEEFFDVFSSAISSIAFLILYIAIVFISPVIFTVSVLFLLALPIFLRRVVKKESASQLQRISTIRLIALFLPGISTLLLLAAFPLFMLAHPSCRPLNPTLQTAFLFVLGLSLVLATIAIVHSVSLRKSQNTHPQLKSLLKYQTRLFIVLLAASILVSLLVPLLLGGGRCSARDARRISDVKQMALIFETEDIGTPNQPIQGCTRAYDSTTLCAGPGDANLLSKEDYFMDPSSSADTPACKATAEQPCQYSISTANGKSGATTADYQICFYLENGAAGLKSGLNSITIGGILQEGCK